MTRDEAIKDIRDNIKPVVGGVSLEMAIKALEQQTCEDAVSREAVLGLFAQNADTPKRRKGIPLEGNDYGYNCENWIP